MFYYLPNKRPIDVEGAIDAILDGNQSNRYFLDIMTGEVGCVEVGSAKMQQRLEDIQREAIRYRELPRVTEEKKREWLAWFVEQVMSFDPTDAPLQSELQKALQADDFQKALAILDSSSPDSGYMWHAIAGDRAFEDLGAWLQQNVPGTTYKLKGCGLCDMPRCEKRRWATGTSRCV